MTNIRRVSIAFAGALALVAGAKPVLARATAHGTIAAVDRAPREPARAFVDMDLRLEPSARGFYVGQAVPVTIRAYFLAGTGVTVNARPRVTSDALVLSDLSPEPRQSTAQVRGLPYTIVTWTGVLTAVKAGTTSTALELPVELSYREAPRMREGSAQRDQRDQNDDQDGQNASDPFASLLRQTPFASDPFFAQMFKDHDLLGGNFEGMFENLAGAVRQRQVTLRAQSRTLPILDLPPGGPAGFTGAVGTFEISAASGGQAFRVGEPTALKLAVRGEGSFSRLSLTGLPATDDFNTYGLTSAFTPGPTPIEGEKVFTQTIAPRRAGPLTIPAVALTYFDPHERKYVTRRTTPMSFTVAASARDDSSPAAGLAAPSTATVPAAARLTAGARNLSSTAGASAMADVVRATLTPAFRTRWFWGLAAAIGLAAVALTILGRTYRNGALGDLVASRSVRREVASQCRTLGAAAARGDAVALFGAARKALQTRLGATWGMPPDAVSTADVIARLGSRGERIRDVFERADRLTYAGGRSVTHEDLSHWRELISDELSALEATT